MATYLITGAAGFIGARVTALLLAAGHHVVGIDNLNDAYDVRLKQWRLAKLQPHPNFNFQPLDICHRDALATLFNQPLQAAQDARAPFAGVIHLAARAGIRQSVADPWTFVETNITGTLNLLELCRAHAIPKFVLASTSSLYGSTLDAKANPLPYHEDADTSRPLSPYAASKKAAEALCYTYHALYGLDITILRYFTVYGPAGRPDMSLFRFVQWICEGRPVVVYGDGRQTRDFTYVDDIARGTILGLQPLGYEIINLGSDQPVALLDAIHQIEAIAHKPAHLEFHPAHAADLPATWADIRKAKQLLGWQPAHPFADGLQQLVAWYLEHRAWASQLATLPAHASHRTAASETRSTSAR